MRLFPGSERRLENEEPKAFPLPLGDWLLTPRHNHVLIYQAKPDEHRNKNKERKKIALLPSKHLFLPRSGSLARFHPSTNREPPSGPTSIPSQNSSQWQTARAACGNPEDTVSPFPSQPADEDHILSRREVSTPQRCSLRMSHVTS